MEFAFYANSVSHVMDMEAERESWNVVIKVTPTSVEIPAVEEAPSSPSFAQKAVLALLFIGLVFTLTLSIYLPFIVWTSPSPESLLFEIYLAVFDSLLVALLGAFWNFAILGIDPTLSLQDSLHEAILLTYTEALPAYILAIFIYNRISGVESLYQAVGSVRPSEMLPSELTWYIWFW